MNYVPVEEHQDVKILDIIIVICFDLSLQPLHDVHTSYLETVQ